MSHLAINKDAMKKENRKQILNLINRCPSTRVNLARETRLTQSAVGIIINKLISENIVTEVGKQDNTVMGRKPVFVDINPRWGYIVGISIDREGFEIGTVDIKGNVIGRITKLDYDDNVQRSLDRIATETNAIINNNGIDTGDIIGVGVVTPGPVDSTNGQILNPPAFDPWHNLKLRDELHRRLPYRIFIDHNADALARAEYSIGIGSKYHSFALFVINAGIGLGLVLNNNVYKGMNGLGCEIGHTSIDINGRLCSCGNRGCLELYASTSAVLYNAGQIQKDIITWQGLVNRAYDGDNFCNGLLDDQAHYLAHSIINLNNLLELNAVIVTGIGAYRGQLLIDKIKSHVEKGIISRNIRNLVIEKSSILDNSAVIAAGVVVIDKLFNGDLYDLIVNHKEQL